MTRFYKPQQEPKFLPRAERRLLRDMQEHLARLPQTPGIGASSTGLSSSTITEITNSLQTMFPLRLLGVTPDLGYDITAILETALNSSEAGDYYIESGDYQINGEVLVETSNVRLWLPPGAHLRGNHSAASNNTLTFQGSETARTANLITTAIERQFTSINIATAGFLVGDWVVVEDDRVASADPTPRHMEINRIKSLDDATHLTLYYPLSDTYVTGSTARITACSPIENCFVNGGGRISNHGIDTSSGGHGLKFALGVNVGASGVTIEDVRNQALKFEECRIFHASEMLLRDAPIFNYAGGNGYGATTTSCVDGIIENCQVSRTRHAFDISFFSRDVSVNGCHVYGNAYAAYQVHPECKRIYFNDCVVDGVSGYDTATGAVMTDAENQGHGFAVREDNEDIHWDGGLIANTILSGVSVDNSGCRNISVRNAVIYRANLRGVIGQAGIYANDRSNLSNSCQNLVFENNIIIQPYVCGVFMTFDNAIARDNIIYDPLPGTAAPAAFRSASPSSVCIGILVAPRTYTREVETFPGSGIFITVTDPLIGLSISSIETENNRVYRVSATGLNRGVQFGGTEFCANNPTSNWTIDIQHCRSLNDRVYGAAKSGFWGAPQTKTAGGFTALISVTTGNEFVRPYAENCNASDDNDEAGIFAANRHAITMAQVLDLFWPHAKQCTRTGICVGFTDQRVQDAKANDGQVLGGGGVGIHIRNFDGALQLNGVCVDRPEAHSNPLEGIRVGSPSGVANVVATQIISPITRKNGSYGVEVMALADDTMIDHPVATDNGVDGIRDSGGGTHIIRPTCNDTGVAVQQRGINLLAASLNAVIVDPWVEGNTTAQITDAGTGTELQMQNLRIVTVGDAAHTFVLPFFHARFGTVLTAPRVCNLPAATMVGMRVRVSDDGAVNGVNVITVTRAGADLIDGVAAPAACVLAVAFASIDLEVVAAGRWKIV